MDQERAISVAQAIQRVREGGPLIDPDADDTCQGYVEGQ